MVGNQDVLMCSCATRMTTIFSSFMPSSNSKEQEEEEPPQQMCAEVQNQQWLLLLGEHLSIFDAVAEVQFCSRRCVS